MTFTTDLGNEPLDKRQRAKLQRAINAAYGSGWIYGKDGVAVDQATGVAFAQNVRQQLTIDGLGASSNYDYREMLPTTMWANSKFNPVQVGESYQLRIDFTARKTSNGENDFLELELDIGVDGSPINIIERRLDFARGANSDHKFSVSFSVFCLDTFVENGGRLFITPTGTGTTIWNAAIQVNRLSVPSGQTLSE